ncbi:SIMPL domain-containing protein [Sphingomonas psychrotolerans]|uniref:SIMPL domain-containing protein n=1 Tax=Sphingomonas psychrotolerans TaxID=1327635 RepID=A0ABU3N488_9SPHN|nr:SIMPL domain-containing protein [Sphingomonas psychrotolerans]MDT8758326.1 SIMPL domain-containing protein [Sphingomonas psychrotolerans]
MKHAIALALLAAPLAAPLAAQAQTITAPGPVSVEIVTTGQVSVPADRYRLSVTLTAKGKDEAAAGAILAANKAKLAQALAALNIREAAPDLTTSSSIINLLASFGGSKSKPSFSLDTPEEDSDDTPQSTATETLTFDASSRAAVESARAPVEANGGKLDDDLLPLLNDYVGPTRQAKAAAIKKAQGEAEAYAATLGLRRAALVKVSEKQDPTAGALALISELVAVVMPKHEGGVDKVTVNASLVVEFQLSR